MEMADYERLVKELNAKITVRDECAEELKAQINTVTQKEDTLKQEIGMYEKYYICCSCTVLVCTDWGTFIFPSQR